MNTLLAIVVDLSESYNRLDWVLTHSICRIIIVIDDI
jgi:hypothetical protein